MSGNMGFIKGLDSPAINRSDRTQGKVERPCFALVLVKSLHDKQRRNSVVSDEEMKPWSGQSSKVDIIRDSFRDRWLVQWSHVSENA